MSLDAFLLGLLEDPVDHQPLLYVASRDVLYNPRRRRAYAVRGPIPVMIDEESRAVDEAEHAQLIGDPEGVWTGTGA